MAQEFYNYKSKDVIRMTISDLSSNSPYTISFLDKVYINLDDHQEIIEYSDIESITILPVSWSYNQGIKANKSGKFIENVLKNGTLFTVGPHMIYTYDMIINTHDHVYKYESLDLKLLPIVSVLEKYAITINDSTHLIDIVKKYSNKYDLFKYLDMNYSKLSKEYKLDNPRGAVYNIE